MLDRIHCDRCKLQKEGYVEQKVTSGCYDVTDGYWAQFANPGEMLICDLCMWNHPLYIEMYGSRR